MVTIDFPQHQHIVIRDGQARIARTNTKIKMIVRWFVDANATPDEIMAQYDLTAGEVYAALSYYFDHRDEFDRLLAEENVAVDRGEASVDLQRRLRERWIAQGKLPQDFPVPPEE